MAGNDRRAAATVSMGDDGNTPTEVSKIKQGITYNTSLRMRQRCDEHKIFR